MSKKILHKLLASCLIISTVVATAPNVTEAAKAKAPKLNIGKDFTMEKGMTKKVSIKKNGAKIKKVSWKVSKKAVLKLSKKSGNSVKIKAKKKGKATITASVKYSISSKSYTKKLKCNVRVITSVAADDDYQSDSPTKAPIKMPENLIEALAPYVTNVGSCVSYHQLNSPENNAYIKENFNSLTAENEMKHSSVLGYNPNLIKTSEARLKGYIIPDGYSEEYVPEINYKQIDTLLEYAYNNNIRVRYHTFLWHEQSANWFFRTGYTKDASYVTPEVMDLRTEYLIKNVMTHIFSGKYKDTVYCFDVVNEYYHMKGVVLDSIEKPDSDNRCYYYVYGNQIFENPDDPAQGSIKTNPEYVKKAFKCAYDVLVQFDLVGKVELVYNDFDTDSKAVRECMFDVSDYVNSKDAINPEGAKLVTTIGMQAHDSVGNDSISNHVKTIQTARDKGYNIQFTEFDLAINGHSEEKQLEHLEFIIYMIMSESMEGAKFTSFTWWGLADSMSWLGSDQKPLLCGTSVTDKKPAYYTILNTIYKYYMLL